MKFDETVKDFDDSLNAQVYRQEPEPSDSIKVNIGDEVTLYLTIDQSRIPVKEEEEVSLVRVTLDTGRFHQIRAQFSAIGHPLLGDKKYGDERSMELSRKKQIRTIALCAWHLKFLHPVTKKEMEFYLQEEDLPPWGYGIQTENRWK